MSALKILLSIIFTLIIGTENLYGQFLNSSNQKMSLSFLKTEYWNNNSECSDTIKFKTTNWLSRTGHKYGTGFLYGLGGGTAGLLTAVGVGLVSKRGNVPLFLIPAFYILGTALGVKNVSDEYGYGISYASYSLITAGGAVGFILPFLVGNNSFSLVDGSSTGNNSRTIMAKVMGALVLSIVAEIAVSELIYVNKRQPVYESDEYNFNDIDHNLLHNYIADTQLINLEILKINF